MIAAGENLKIGRCPEETPPPPAPIANFQREPTYIRVDSLDEALKWLERKPIFPPPAPQPIPQPLPPKFRSPVLPSNSPLAILGEQRLANLRVQLSHYNEWRPLQIESVFLMVQGEKVSPPFHQGVEWAYYLTSSPDQTFSLYWRTNGDLVCPPNSQDGHVRFQLERDPDQEGRFVYPSDLTMIFLGIRDQESPVIKGIRIAFR